MGILDEAIREHLELKRQHGAAESELKQLEGEAFGPPERPGSEASDAAAEAPTELMPAPQSGEETQRREAPAIADLQEAPPPPEPVEEEPAAEHEAVAEQPTEHFDVEEELASAKRGPTEEELIEEEIAEPRLGPVDPLADVEEAAGGEAESAPEAAEAEDAPDAAALQPEVDEDEEEDEFWSDQRLSEELDNALDAPLPDEGEAGVAEAPAAESEPLGEVAEAEQLEEGEPSGASDPDNDVLEDTPEFLEDAPEDDELWFEQKPPKDFDFDD